MFWGRSRGSKKAKNLRFSSFGLSGHLTALGSAWEAGAGLIWVDFNLVMPQQAPIRWAAQTNHGHPRVTAFTFHLKGSKELVTLSFIR